MTTLMRLLMSLQPLPLPSLLPLPSVIDQPVKILDEGSPVVSKSAIECISGSIHINVFIRNHDPIAKDLHCHSKGSNKLESVIVYVHDLGGLG